jgi:hypothetical protein
MCFLMLGNCTEELFDNYRYPEYVKFDERNFRILHLCCICRCRFKNNVLYLKCVYYCGLTPYQI